MDLYSARIHQLSGAQGALLPLLIRLIHHSWNHLSSLGSIQLNCCHYRYRAGANQPILPSQVPMGGEKQLWLSVLLKDTSVMAGIRTHILLLTPELESGKLDRSATTLQNMECKASPLLFHDKCPGFFYVHYTTHWTYSFTSHPKDEAITVIKVSCSRTQVPRSARPWFEPTFWQHQNLSPTH